MNALTFDDDDESNFFRWYYAICAWIPLNIDDNLRGVRTHFLDKRDDRLTGLAYYAAFVSVQKCLENVVSNVSFRYIDDFGKTIKAIQDEVLHFFSILCQDLLIEKCWDVVRIRNIIMEAASFAMAYTNSSHVDELCFPGNDKQRGLLLTVFQGFLIGNFRQEGFHLQNNDTIDVMDDGLVGLSVEIQKIKDKLIGSDLNLYIIPIIGMGGIGKTTLARKVYKDPQIMSLFLVHAWVVVSYEFNERDVYLELLESIAPIPDKVYREDTEQLAVRLYRRLKGWRYLIVLDDIWTKSTWDSIKLCFPNDNNGSRIILTSGIMEVASHVNHENPPHFMSFLCIEESWELLQKKVYGNEICPRHMMTIGMQLAEKCQGLPLAIEVMGGYLSSINKTQESWKDVVKTVDFPTEATQLESLSKILFISFHELPHQLKKCFLTMTIFPKNFDISLKKLIQMWIAMGFLTQNMSDSEEDINLEEVAMTYFESLMNKSLIMVKERTYDGKAKLCGVHDLLWDLSMREFCKEFSCDDDQKHVIRINRTLLYLGHSFESDYPISFEAFKLLRVLDIINQSFDSFPIVVTDLSNLRYLALSTSDNIPHLISKLSYLETLLNYHKRVGQILPSEIWLLAYLKHLHIGTCTFFSEPPKPQVEGSSNSLLPFLFSLSYLSFASCTNEVFCNTPHLKHLGIVEDGQDDVKDDQLLFSTLKSIINLQQLEKLKLCCNYKVERIRCIPKWGNFLPNTIKKLTLSRSHLPWGKMETLATLPNLEVLKLRFNAFKGEAWVMNDEQFMSLKYLLLESMDLIFWQANNDNFPKLQHLHIKFCRSLRGIPREFGEIYTLELIDLDLYHDMVYTSAIEIQRRQIALGNDTFNLKLGRTSPESQTMGYTLFFIWLATKLNISHPKEEGQETKNSRASSV